MIEVDKKELLIASIITGILVLGSITYVSIDSFLKDRTSPPRGWVYINYAPNGEYPIFLYKYNIFTEKIFQKSFVKSKVNTDINFSDEKQASLVTRVFGTSKNNETQIEVVDSGSQLVSAKTRSFGIKGNPQWSPNKDEIAFSSRGLSVENKDIPENSKVYVFDLDTGRELFVALGLYPQWSPEGNDIIYLKSDGLYIYDRELRQESRIINIPNSTASNVQFDISRDKNLITWSNFETKELSLVEIISWEPFAIEDDVKTVSVSARWPIFSEDDSFIAFHEIEGDSSNISTYSIKSDKLGKNLDLSGFSTESIKLNDWVFY